MAAVLCMHIYTGRTRHTYIYIIIMRSNLMPARVYICIDHQVVAGVPDRAGAVLSVVVAVRAGSREGRHHAASRRGPDRRRVLRRRHRRLLLRRILPQIRQSLRRRPQEDRDQVVLISIT